MIYVTCPQCETEHELTPESAGTCVICGHCGKELQIMGIEAEEEPKLAPLEETPALPPPLPVVRSAPTVLDEPRTAPPPRPRPPSTPKLPPRREEPRDSNPPKLKSKRLAKTAATTGAMKANADKKTSRMPAARPAKPAKPFSEDDEEDDDGEDWRNASARPRWFGPTVVAAFAIAILAAGGVGGYYLINASKETPREEPPVVERKKPPLTVPVPPASRDRTPPADPPKTTGNVVTAPASGREIYHELLRSTVWITVRLEKGRATGSGVLIDRSNRLILTNHHVINGAIETIVYFPQEERGKVVVNPKTYLERTKPAEQIVARVLAKDGRSDLALLQVSRLPETASAVVVAARSPSPGDAVHSIGNPASSDSLWIYTSGTVRQVYRKKWRAGNGAIGSSEHEADVVETQSPTNPGDSGGPLVNSAGELVGLTQGGVINAQLMSIFIDASEINRFVESSCRGNSLTWARGTPRSTVSPTNVLQLVKELESMDGLVRARAAQALGEAGPQAKLAVPPLLKGIKDADPLFRKLALEALDKIGAPDKSDVDLLRESLRDESVTVRNYSAEALGRIGAEARPAAAELATALQSDTSPGVRQHAAEALGKIGAAGKPAAFPALIAALKDSDPATRAAAAQAIVSLGPLAEADMPAILGVLPHEDLEVRIAAAQALAHASASHRSVVPRLIELAGPGQDARLRRAALISLKAHGKDAKAALPLLGAVLRDDSSAELRQAACGILLQLGPDARSAVGPLAESLSSADGPTRALYLEVLEKLGPDARDAVPALKKILTGKDKEQILTALTTLGAIGKEAKDAAPAIVVLFDDRELLDRAVDTISKIGKPAVPYLIGGMRDRSANVRLGSVRAVGQIGADARAAAQPLAILGQTDPIAAVRADAVDAFRKVMSGPPPMVPKKKPY